MTNQSLCNSITSMDVQQIIFEKIYVYCVLIVIHKRPHSAAKNYV